MFSREYQDALSRARMIHAQIATTRTQVQLSEENLRLSRLRYDGGEGSALDVVAAQNQLAQAHTNHYTALVRYLESWADLKVASGE
jgi:outer membrane protein TolC